MVELTVGDAAASAAWYAAALGFTVALTDPATGFVLLTRADGGRVALMPGGPVAAGVKMHFEVSDLDGHVARLHTLGVGLDGGVKASAEGYRRVRLRDPDGVVVVLFEWCGPPA